MRIGLISDAHGNVEAFRLALDVLRRLGAERFLFLGDAVGYLPGDAVVRELMRLGIDCILGNHEAMLLREPIDAERDLVYRLNETGRTLSPDVRSFIAGWPTQRHLESRRGAVWLVHGSPADPTFGYVYPDTDLAAFEVAAGVTVVMGNTHRPFVREQGGARFVNLGSCGLPRDAGRLGAAALMNLATGEVRIIRFDIGDAIDLALARSGPVHPDVLAVHRRPVPSDLVGEVHVQ